MILERFFRTGLHAFHTENTFCSILPLSGVVRYFYIHGTDFLTSAAGYTLACITFYPQNREITHRLQKHRYRTEILAERTVIFEEIRKENPCRIVQKVSDDKHPEQY